MSAIANKVSLVAAILAPAVCCAERFVVGSNIGSEKFDALRVVSCDISSGSLKLEQEINGVGYVGSTYGVFSKDGSKFYTVIREKRGEKNLASVVLYRVKDGRLGSMERIADLPIGMPCHVALSSDDRYFGFAAYTSAAFGTVDLKTGKMNYSRLLDVGMGPNIERQKKAYAHFIFFMPGSIGVIDLGCDAIHFFDNKSLEKKLTLKHDPGDGPRHAVWSKDNKFFYVLNELSNSVTLYKYKKGKFARIAKYSTLPSEISDSIKTKAAAIKFSPDGRFLVCSNRGYDSLAIFKVDTITGTLKLAKIAKLNGEFPRDFEFTSNGKFVIVGHKKSNNFCTYEFCEQGERVNLREVQNSRIEAFEPLYFGRIK